MSMAVVDSLPEPGGQISALYPEKLIHDVAGLPGVRGRDLVAGLVQQANQYDPMWLLGQSAAEIDRLDDGRIAILTTTGERLVTRSIVLAAGIGTFTPRPLPAGGDFVGCGIDYFVTD